MQTFIYTVRHESPKRGYNRTVVVYRIVKNKPIFIDSDIEINTASYKGDYAVACKIISDKLGYKLDGGDRYCGAGYKLERKDVKIIEV